MPCGENMCVREAAGAADSEFSINESTIYIKQVFLKRSTRNTKLCIDGLTKCEQRLAGP